MKYKGEGFGLDTVVKDDGKRHVNPLSYRFKAIEDLKAEIEDAKGEWLGKAKWTNERTDKLLNCYFLHVADKPSIHACKILCVENGRSFDGIATKLRKLGRRHRGDPTDNYEPIKRADRSNTPFVLADYAFMEMASDPNCEGIKNGANDPIWLAKLTARRPDEIKREQLRLSKQGERLGLLDQIPSKETEDERIIRLVHLALKGAFQAMLDSL